MYFKNSNQKQYHLRTGGPSGLTQVSENTHQIGYFCRSRGILKTKLVLTNANH